ncbi:MAG TPA: hypothetical protein VFE12_08445, partial [Acetobacteraceae bacterium]|nr:hypothetical protein [Acetobacteraceae bacterium]
MSDETVVVPLGSTPGGLPYPEDTDQVMMGAQAIKALAQAIEAAPWWNFIRWTQGVLGTTADAPLNTWDSQESNFTIGEPATSGGVICPKAGLYQVSVIVELFAAWNTNPLCSVGVKTSATPPRELFLQRIEPTVTTNRRVYAVSGVLRAAQAERISAFMNQPGGFGTVNHSSGAAAYDRHSSRF